MSLAGPQFTWPGAMVWPTRDGPNWNLGRQCPRPAVPTSGLKRPLFSAFTLRSLGRVSAPGQGWASREVLLSPRLASPCGGPQESPVLWPAWAQGHGSPIISGSNQAPKIPIIHMGKLRPRETRLHTVPPRISEMTQSTMQGRLMLATADGWEKLDPRLCRSLPLARRRAQAAPGHFGPSRRPQVGVSPSQPLGLHL